MARNAPTISCGPDERRELQRLAGSRTESKQMVERARIILGCLAGKRVREVARQCHTRPNTVIKWRQRFASHGLQGLQDAPRPGAKRIYDQAFRNRVLAVLEQSPPVGQATWDGPAVAKVVDGSVDAVWRVLRKGRAPVRSISPRQREPTAPDSARKPRTGLARESRS